MATHLNALFAPVRPTPTQKDGHILHHAATNTSYIAHPFNCTTHPVLLSIPPPPSLPDNQLVGVAAAFRVLNHENLLPPLGPIWTASATPLLETGQFDGRGREWGYSLVYEHASEGSLAQVFDNPPVEVTEYGFLPEGMVWHVALGMLRAMAWLHAGMRERVFLGDGEEEEVRRGWWKVDGDWMPVLHRGVEEGNIWFMKGRGRESYGMVKLGGFERAVVCAGGEEEMVVAFGEGELGSLEEEKEAWRERGTENWREMYTDSRPYTVSSEVQALGRVLYRMMKGERYPVDERCACTCYHVEPEYRCPHDCIVSDFHFDEMFVEGEHKYSAELVELARQLLSAAVETYVPTSERYRRAFVDYETWRKGTSEGRRHVDHYDDLLERKRFARKKEEERLARGARALQAERKMSGKWTEKELEELAKKDQQVIKNAMKMWLVDNGRLLEWEL